MKKNKRAFSIIEILVWILVFSLWITAVYSIISSTLRINDYNKNYIIATNLAREQIELVRNIRDSNYSEIKPYNLLNPSFDDFENIENSDKFEYDNQYKIENYYSTYATFPIKISNITTWFEEWVGNLLWSSMQSYILCIDSKNRYIYCTWASDEIKTKFYKFIDIKKVKYSDWWTTKEINNSFLVTSKVIWYIRWYHEFEVKSIITDWKRL